MNDIKKGFLIGVGVIGALVLLYMACLACGATLVLLDPSLY